tara:strand:- start:417 stop:704 length:288 start_codon:yes stop_codon:yes gene_type:complete
MVMAEGIGRQLNPDTDMWVMSKPLVNDWLYSTDLKVKYAEEVFMDINMARKKIPEIIDKLNLLVNNKSPNNENIFKTLNVSIFAFTILIIIVILK